LPESSAGSADRYGVAGIVTFNLVGIVFLIIGQFTYPSEQNPLSTWRSGLPSYTIAALGGNWYVFLYRLKSSISPLDSLLLDQIAFECTDDALKQYRER
jgi:hypothetical protein